MAFAPTVPGSIEPFVRALSESDFFEESAAEWLLDHGIQVTSHCRQNIIRLALQKGWRPEALS